MSLAAPPGFPALAPSPAMFPSIVSFVARSDAFATSEPALAMPAPFPPEPPLPPLPPFP